MKYWVAVASAEHVRLGVGGGFMQVGHGKGAPLRRIAPGDRVVYYSPAETLGGRDKLQAFTALGTVKEGVPYVVDMGNAFHPWRRDVQWVPANAASIRPLLGKLSFTQGTRSWGARFRFGLFPIDEPDFVTIATAMSQGTKKHGR